MPLEDKKTKDRICKFCGIEMAKGEFHEEFDYFKHPLVKGQLLALREKYLALPIDEQLYRMENYAVRRGLRRGANIVEVPSPSGSQKKPEGGTVVMPGYDRLVYADIWLRKMDGEQVKYLKPEERDKVFSSELPF